MDKKGKETTMEEADQTDKANQEKVAAPANARFSCLSRDLPRCLKNKLTPRLVVGTVVLFACVSVVVLMTQELGSSRSYSYNSSSSSSSNTPLIDLSIDWSEIDWSDITDLWCFSECTEVEVLGQGPTRMDALKIGEAVRVGDGTYSKVYSFGHHNPSHSAKFCQIWTNKTRHPLEITGNHLLYVLGKSSSKNSVKMLPASAVEVGDLLVTPKGSAAITSITTVQRQGLYAPFTMSGNLVANGVACSNYIALPKAFQDWASFEQQHWLQYIAIMPYRLYCGPAGCQGETYDEELGLSKAVMLWLPLLHFVESALPWLTHATAIGLAYFVWKKQQGYKISKAKAVE